jgi:hypothetical protein
VERDHLAQHHDLNGLAIDATVDEQEHMMLHLAAGQVPVGSHDLARKPRLRPAVARPTPRSPARLCRLRGPR